MKVKRNTNIIYPKDAALIIMLTGICSGYKVLEAGTGSGALAMSLAYYVKPEGKVYSYERREEFVEPAKSNLEKAGLDKYVEFKIGDIADKIEETDLDTVVTDIPEPWKTIESVYNCLKAGGFWVIYLPSTSQMEKTVIELDKHKGFIKIDALENLIRFYKVAKNATRPEFEMIGHTGFLIFLRKITK